jgi:hypothetical protein
MAQQCRLDSRSLRHGPKAGFCQNSNEPSRFIKLRKFIDQMSYYKFREKLSALHVICNLKGEDPSRRTG